MPHLEAVNLKIKVNILRAKDASLVDLQGISEIEESNFMLHQAFCPQAGCKCCFNKRGYYLLLT